MNFGAVCWSIFINMLSHSPVFINHVPFQCPRLDSKVLINFTSASFLLTVMPSELMCVCVYLTQFCG